jgi:transposase-like protein
MWMLFHRRAGTKVVSGGHTFVEHCPTCDKPRRFREIEVSESYGVFFVDVVGDKERKYRCDSCEDVFDLRDKPAALPEPKRHKVEDLAAEQRRRDDAKAKIATKIEDELAELKKRLGK